MPAHLHPCRSCVWPASSSRRSQDSAAWAAPTAERGQTRRRRRLCFEALKLPISPQVGEMSGRTEGGAKELASFTSR
ncbi:MAG: hypothetical protein E5X19_28140, partial [Mesorhizobium sp.]